MHEQKHTFKRDEIGGVKDKTSDPRITKEIMAKQGPEFASEDEKKER